jgi:hypothetical protein
MKRKALFLLALFQSFVVYAQIDFWDEMSYPGISLTIMDNADVWSSKLQTHRTDNSVTKRLLQGEMVLGDILYWAEINHVFGHVAMIRYENNLYAIRAGDLSPVGSMRLPRDWIRTPDAQKKWVISYYLDVLHSQDRDMFLKYERPYIENLMEMIRHNIDRGEARRDDMWYNEGFFVVDLESLAIFDAVIVMGGFWRTNFFVMNIVPFDIGYKITVAGDRWFAASSDVIATLRQLPFPLWEERQNFDMIFIPDGDFIDVYLDTLDNHFASFAKVDTAVLEELHALVETNIVDLSRIVWPRRADGSRHLTPPEISSNVPAQQVVEEPVEIIYDVEDQESTVVQQNDDVPPMPFWLWFAIIGGVVVAGVVVLAVKRKR